MEAKKRKIDASVGIDNMPYEILVKILSYLPISHLKKARLVCHPWYEASQDMLILKHQNFVCNRSNHCGMRDMVTMLVDGDFSYYNLKFVREKLSAYNNFERFVSSHGAKIYSLSFQSCEFSFEMIEKIMINCTNLKELIVDFDEFSTLNYYPVRILNKPRRPMENGREIVREKLITLKLSFYSEFSVDLCSLFMDVYPSIKELHVIPNNNDRNFHKYERLIAQKCYQIPKFCLQPPKRMNMKDYSTMFTDKNLISIWDKLSVGGPRVSILGLTMHYGSIIELDVYEIKFGNIPIIFQNFPVLKHLRVREFPHGDAITGISNVLKSIAESRLKSLYLGFSSNHDTSPDEIIGDIPWINQSMERFSIDATRFSHDLVVHMLKMFPNLTSLCFNVKLDSEILKQDVTSYIFERLVKLKYLILNVILRNCSVDPFYGINTSPNSVNDASFEHCSFFPNLECLTLKNCNSLTEQGIEKFINFPNLKFLNVDRCYNIKDSGVIKLSESSPYLEWLDISDVPISKDTLLQIADNLKYLRFLVLVGREVHAHLYDYPSDAFHQVFLRCPDLRGLQYLGRVVLNCYEKTIMRRWGDPSIPNYSKFY